MNGHEFHRRVEGLDKKTGVQVRFDARKGKGSHGCLYFGEAFTTLKDRNKEIGLGLFRAMCRQLGIDPRDL